MEGCFTIRGAKKKKKENVEEWGTKIGGVIKNVTKAEGKKYKETIKK